MSKVKIGNRRQLTIPKIIFDDLGLREGDYVEITKNKKHIIIKPKKNDNFDDILTPEEEKIVEKGVEQLKRGESVKWEDLRNELDL